MNEAEKERLIRKDLVSIENKVRHAFNQGYEMGMKDREKLNCTDCIIEKSDSFIKSCLEIPNTCGDAISRQAVLDLMRGLTRWCVRSEDGKWKNVGLLYDDVMFGIDGLPSVTPQQRTGRWIDAEVLDKIRAEIDQYLFQNEFGSAYRKEVSQIIDKYKAESEAQE